MPCGNPKDFENVLSKRPRLEELVRQFSTENIFQHLYPRHKHHHLCPSLQDLIFSYPKTRKKKLVSLKGKINRVKLMGQQQNNLFKATLSSTEIVD